MRSFCGISLILESGHYFPCSIAAGNPQWKQFADPAKIIEATICKSLLHSCTNAEQHRHMALDDRLGEFEAFAEIARTLSVTMASRRLDVAASSISRRLTRLEKRLVTRLVERSTRSVVLTEEGRAFLPECLQVLEAYGRATEHEAVRGKELRGTIRMSLPNSFGRHQVLPLLPAFASRHPQLSFNVELTDRYVDLPKEGFDLSIRIGPAQAASEDTRLLGVNRRLVCASPAYLAKFGVPTRPAQLSSHQCLCFTALMAGDTWTFTRGRAFESVTVQGRYRVNDADAVRSLAIAAQGIAIQAEFNATDDIAAGRLVRILSGWRLPVSPITARVASAKFIPNRVALFIDYLRDALPPYLRK
jgi:DNA-binding transcriptional LysR family regulator